MGLVAVGAPTAALAEEDASLLGGVRVGLGFGVFDVLRPEQQALDFRFELELVPVWRGLSPWVGIEATSESDILGYLGLKYDWEVSDGWRFVPSFAVGAYEDGGDKSLDNVLQFRSQLGLAYRWDNGMQLEVSFGHISNAGFGDTNAGAETLAATFSVPFGNLPLVGE